MGNDFDGTKARCGKKERGRGRLFLAIALFGPVMVTARGASASVVPVCGGFTCTGNNGNPLPTGSNNANQNPQIIVSFWGSAWQQATQAPTRGQLIGATLSLVNGPYFSQLNEYRGAGVIGLPRMAPYAPIYTFSTPPTSFTHDDVKNVINDEINRGMLPAPQTGVDMIYTVFMPASSAFAGAGNGFNGTNTWTPANGGAALTYRFAWIATNGANSTAATASATAALSHELVEAITGYQQVEVSNCTANPDNDDSTDQISDYCQCDAAMEIQNGYQLQGYYSQQVGGCIIPEAWGGVSEDVNPAASTSFQPISPMPVRQIYGGVPSQGSTDPSMLIATDVNDNLFLRAGAGWASIGGKGAMFAMGTNTIARISQDASNVLSYSLVSFVPTWISLGTPNGQPVTSVTVTGDDWIVATDPGGNPFVFDPNANNWQQFGGPGDEFIASNHAILALIPSQGGVGSFDSSGFLKNGSWSGIAGPASHIIANPCEESISFGAISLDAAQSFLRPEVVTGAATFAWSTQIAAGYSFAIGGPFDGADAMIDVDQGQFPFMALTTNTSVVPRWSQLPGFPAQAGRAVGTCDMVLTGTPTIQGPSVLELLDKCLDVPGGNANAGYVEVWMCNGGSNQHWVYFSDKTIRPAFDLTMCLDTMAANPVDGQVVALFKCQPADLNQQWVQVTNANGFFELQNVQGRCLNAANSVAGQDTTNGTKYIMWDCQGTPNELFAF